MIDTDATQRAAVEQACRAAGLSVHAVSTVAEVERWPEGHIVVIDAAHLTPWWRSVGAAEVIVLVRDAAEGVVALENGATRWLQPAPDADVIAAMVHELACRKPSGEPRD